MAADVVREEEGSIENPAQAQKKSITEDSNSEYNQEEDHIVEVNTTEGVPFEILSNKNTNEEKDTSIDQNTSEKSNPASENKTGNEVSDKEIERSQNSLQNEIYKENERVQLEVKNQEKEQNRRYKYLDNIKLSNSNAGLSLKSGKENIKSNPTSENKTANEVTKIGETERTPNLLQNDIYEENERVHIEVKNKEKEQSRPSNYSENIKISNFSAGLSFKSGKENNNEKNSPTSENKTANKVSNTEEAEITQNSLHNDINKENERVLVEKEQSRRFNYSENIKISNSSAALSLKCGKDDLKQENLLSDSTTVVRFSPAWKQTLAASGPILLTFTAGLTSGYSAILLPQLLNENGPIPSDQNTLSWIASIAALPMAPGCLLAGYIMEKFGRRNSHYMISAPFLLGWILIACASNLGLMLAGRFFTGICVGLLGPLGPVYIAETSEPRLRGFFLAGISLAIALGIFAAHLIGTFLSWQWTAIICCLFPIISGFLLTVVPESPTWLISKGRMEEGVKAFYWLRGYSTEAKIELKGIIDNKKAVDLEPVPTLKEKLAYFRSPELVKPLLIMIIFFVTCQFSGVNAVAFYSIDIVQMAVGTGIDHYLGMLVIDFLRVIMSVVACVVCKQYGRRPLCIISGVWTAISMVGLSLFLYWRPENMVWLPLSCLLIYIAAISIGLVPLPWIMCGEVFPLKVRGLGSGISSALTFTAFFVVVKTAPGMMRNLGEVITFLTYGFIALIGTAILYVILPETKGKSLQEIEERFVSGKKTSELKV